MPSNVKVAFAFMSPAGVDGLCSIDLDAQAVRLRHDHHAVGDLEGMVSTESRSCREAISLLVEKAGMAAATWSMAAAEMPNEVFPPSTGMTPAAAATAAHALAGTMPPTCSRSISTNGAALHRTAVSTSLGPRIARHAANGTLVCRASDASDAVRRIRAGQEKTGGPELQTGAEVAGGFHIELPLPVEPEFHAIAHHFTDGRQTLEVFVGPPAAGDGLRVKTLVGQFA